MRDFEDCVERNIVGLKRIKKEKKILLLSFVIGRERRGEEEGEKGRGEKEREKESRSRL